MNPLNPLEKSLSQVRSEVLQQLEDWLDVPMLVLSFGWLTLLIIELIWDTNPFLNAVSLTIWILFIFDFLLEFVLAPHKGAYLRRNWLTVCSLVLPALRTLRIFRVMRAARGVRLLGVMTRTTRGMRSLSASFQRRGFGYVVASTAIVTLGGAAGMYAFERDLPNGLESYSTALWWTAMLMTTMGSDYFPQSPEGRILCFILAVYGFAIFGYVTATIATFFVGQDAENEQAEIAGVKSIQALQTEIAALRTEIQSLSRNHQVANSSFEQTDLEQ
ncbi:potassium channel protein [Phormidesmis priestleyi ULC007]|uniref:Potassium channel protein n=1 Tax=Phormidesmis priestleyi ULC007 TaxID=1920490 RepID=A0A2T1DM18_9CYAN|nr:potassium channel family protein [Phormidesmis priestleyi]PSB21547.1 potassium channel protein [Phormidesmis priestleyi ULC007]PZO54587.1 MAG: potassium channel protein [Phormidesmis priestleyi]